MTIVTDLDLPVFDNMAADLTGDVYHQRLAEVRKQGWLAQSPLSVVVLDRESGEFFLRSKATVFPGREIADIFGITGGRQSLGISADRPCRISPFWPSFFIFFIIPAMS